MRRFKASGEILVSGVGSAEVELEDRPRIISVRFSDDDRYHHHPCDHHHDKLGWRVEESRRHTTLIIWYEVAGIREVEWIAEF